MLQLKTTLETLGSTAFVVRSCVFTPTDLLHGLVLSLQRNLLHSLVQFGILIVGDSDFLGALNHLLLLLDTLLLQLGALAEEIGVFGRVLIDGFALLEHSNE